MAGADVLIALASGVPVAVLGVLLLALRPRQPDQLFFGGFALLWGAEAVGANLVRVLPTVGAAQAAFLLSFAVTPPCFLFLARFAERVGLGEPRRGILAAAVGLAVAASLALALAPSLVLARVDVQPGGPPRVAFGPLAGPLFFLPFFGMFYLAIAQLYLHYRAAPPGVNRDRSRAVLMAFALYASYNAVQSLLLFSNPAAAARLAGGVGVLATQAVFAVGTAMVAGIALHGLVRPMGGRVDRALLAAFVVPALWAAAERALAGQGLAVDTTGVWRIATVGLLGYALARYQLFDIDVRIKRGIAKGVVAGAFIGVFFAAGNLAQNVVSDQYGQLVGIGAAAGLAFLDRPVKRFADRVAGAAMPGVRDDLGYLEARRREVYRGALERVLADGRISPEEDQLLRDLQRTLGLTARECRAIAQDTRAALSAAPA